MASLFLGVDGRRLQDQGAADCRAYRAAPADQCRCGANSTGGPARDGAAAHWQRPGQLRSAGRTGDPVYRPDLDADDPYSEREYFHAHAQSRVRSVVDVLFSRGTLAVSSDLPNAFTPSQLATIGDLALVLDEAFRRHDDFVLLERIRRELVDEIAARQRDLHRERVMARMRDQILPLNCMSELVAHLQGEWTQQLVGLGVPVHGASLQAPSSVVGCYTIIRQHADQRPPDQAYPLSRCPWVGEAWQTGVPDAP